MLNGFCIVGFGLWLLSFLTHLERHQHNGGMWTITDLFSLIFYTSSHIWCFIQKVRKVLSELKINFTRNASSHFEKHFQTSHYYTTLEALFYKMYFVF